METFESGDWTSVNKSSQRFLIVMSIILFFVESVFGQKVISEDRGPGVIDQVVILPEADFTYQVIEKLASKFALEESKGMNLYRLTFATNEEDLQWSHWGYDPRHDTYSSILDELNKAPLPTKPMARLLGIQGSALLSFRDANGLTEKVLLGSKDPTKFFVNGVENRLIHFKLIEGSLTMPRRSRYYLALFIVVGKDPAALLSISACFEATKHFLQLTKVPNLNVCFRPDTWFLDCEGPRLYRFVKDFKIINAAQYVQVSHASCGKSPVGPMSCGGNKILP